MLGFVSFNSLFDGLVALRRSDGKDVAGSYRAKVRSPKGDESLGGPGGPHKLDFNPVLGVHLDHRAQIACAQPMCRKVAIQNHGLEKREVHSYSGRTVTSLKSSRQGACIQTVTTRAAR